MIGLTIGLFSVARGNSLLFSLFINLQSEKVAFVDSTSVSFHRFSAGEQNG